jgi:hypothetical protein
LHASKKIGYTCNTLIFEFEKVCGMTTFGIGCGGTKKNHQEGPGEKKVSSEYNNNNNQKKA